MVSKADELLTMVYQLVELGAGYTKAKPVNVLLIIPVLLKAATISIVSAVAAAEINGTLQRVGISIMVRD